MRQRKPKADYVLSVATFALIIFGTVMISSASVVLSFDKFQTNNYYLIRHIVNVLAGTGALILCSMIDYRTWKKWSPMILFSALVLLFSVFLFGFQFGGAKRWLHIGPMSVQPTELTKLFYVIYLAAWLENKKEKIKDFKYGFVPFLVMTGFIGILVLLQPDFGTASVIMITAALMYVTSGATFEQIALGALGVVSLGWVFIKSSAYRFARFTVFLNPEADTQGAGYHINQALLAIGSGGLFGLGFGMSRQKYNYLPEPMGDSIFAIIAEEMGFIRSMLLLAVFVLIAIRGYSIARRAADGFGRFLAFGITTWIVVQTVINISAMLSLIPLTGVPLPFMSYGGTSIIALMAGIGILLNISRNSQGEVYESPNSGWRNRRAYNPSLARSRRVKRKRL